MQDHIESENQRLEREQQFWAKEIVVKIEYKFCPNLTIIDTPGMTLPAMNIRHHNEELQLNPHAFCAFDGPKMQVYLKEQQCDQDVMAHTHTSMVM